MSTTHTEVSSPRARAAISYAQQSQKLSLEASTSYDQHDQLQDHQHDGTAVGARFITPLDPVIETADGNRLPAVPVLEAHKFNALKNQIEGKDDETELALPRGMDRFDRSLQQSKSELESKAETKSLENSDYSNRDPLLAQGDKLGVAIPPSQTHPLFPPLPLWGPPSLLRDLQCIFFRITSFYLSTAFLLVIVLGAVFTSIPKIAHSLWLRLTFRNADKRRPFYEETRRRADLRKRQDEEWAKKRKKSWRRQSTHSKNDRLRSSDSTPSSQAPYEPLEGGRDKLVCDVRYYARRVGLDVEEFKVQTEDGFIIALWHVYNPKEYTAMPENQRAASLPEVFTSATKRSFQSAADGHSNGSSNGSSNGERKRKYPVLLMHGLLQSAGAFCTNDDDSLAFFLAKSGYDVWLGNNRCGFHPEHSLLSYTDPRMWAWNIRQMGVMDLPALVSRVLEETGFPKLGLVCHSQGTTETFVALAKEQRPELGEKISVFCALAPAVYAGPLIGKMHFKFMRIISPAMFRIFFGIHAFIPLMMDMHRILPGKFYGAMGYLVFSFLFNWSDDRWDRGLRNRLFQFSPVYVSSESMRWWLGRECFAKHRCILSTREEGQMEDVEDEEDEVEREAVEEEKEEAESDRRDRGTGAWYSDQVPPMALWIAGSDDLVDGKRLLRRFERGREPHVKLVHSHVIPEYEHLDVLWAMDAIEKVGKEVRDVIWKTVSAEDRKRCRPIEGVDW